VNDNSVMMEQMERCSGVDDKNVMIKQIEWCSGVDECMQVNEWENATQRIRGVGLSQSTAITS
ncbi:hypothetical protein THOM_0080, partial [Trachipleistophora hominis]